MRTTSLSITCLLLSGTLPAQLINGSFEDNGAFSLTGWEWTCGAPTSVTSTPVGGRFWSARKEIGNVKGCWPSHLYQRIPFAQDGEIWQLSGWVRSDTLGIPLTAWIGLATVSNGLFNWDSAIGSSGYDWSYVYINDTVHATASDTAIVLLNPGTLGGPAYGAGWFDAIELHLLGPQAVHEAQPALHHYLDENMVLHLATDEDLLGAQLLDLSGRMIPLAMERTAPAAMRVNVAALPRGVYIINAATSRGTSAARFIRP